jgi:hypothetical protein
LWRIPPWEEVKDERLGEGGTQTFVDAYYTTFPQKRKRESLQFRCSFSHSTFLFSIQGFENRLDIGSQKPWRPVRYWPGRIGTAIVDR